MKEFIVREEQKGLRLDKYLVEITAGLTRNKIQRLIKQAKVKINSKPVVSPAHKINKGDTISACLDSFSETIPLSSQDVPVKYQDKDVIVIDKPAGLIVHPAGKNKDSVIGSLLNMGISLAENSPARPGVVHRLDKDTSGLMVLAKNLPAYQALYSQFKERRVTKEYIAWVEGSLSLKEGKIDIPLKRQKYKPKMKISFLNAKKSLTYYKVLQEKPGFSLVRVYLKTGRMHQIRVHFAYLGHPVAGDKKYGKESKNAPRLYLHSAKLGFYGPLNGEYLEFESRPSFLNTDTFPNP
jgi:23S rRNA pseudouridine1911/1915/1917 synthase